MRDAEVFKTEDGKQVEVEGFDLKAFAKKHGLKIGIGVTLGIAAIIFGKRYKKSKELYEVSVGDVDNIFDVGHIIKNAFISPNDLPVPDNFVSGRIDSIWNEEGYIHMLVDDIPITDLGNFGKELKEKIPELKDADFAHMAPVMFSKHNIDGPLVPVTTVAEDSLEKTLEAIGKIEKAKNAEEIKRKYFS